MALLEAQAVAHSYRRFPGRRITSLGGVDLVVQPGECWGLLGPNGSGKSTLLRIAAGLAEPHAGRVTVDGRSATTRVVRQATGYVPESMNWPRALTVIAVLHELASLSGTGDAFSRIEQAAVITGLGGLLDRRLGTLSRGQARRVVIAQALLDNPQLLLLDEPFAGLDSLVIADIEDHLRERLAAGAGIVLASHRLEDFHGLATHMLVLRDGLVVRRGAAMQILSEARNRDGLAALLGSED
jgi:ABC-type multidrug transport system ATPase subunit